MWGILHQCCRDDVFDFSLYKQGESYVLFVSYDNEYNKNYAVQDKALYSFYIFTFILSDIK